MTAFVVVLMVALAGLGIGAVSRYAAARSAGERAAATDIPPTAGIQTDPASNRIVLPKDPRLLVVGDSFAQGYDARPQTNGFAYVFAKGTGWPYQVLGDGGTGWTWGGDGGGKDTYENRIAKFARTSRFKPNVVLLEGGLNDYRATPSDEADAVTASVTQLRTAYPGVQVVVMGPMIGWPRRNIATGLSEEIADGALAADAPYIDPAKDGWISESRSKQYVIADGTHLNTAGHAYVAGRVAAAFRAATRS